MKNKLFTFLALSVISTYGCTKENISNVKIKVQNCSYDDEYFDYCKKNYLNQYQDALQNQVVNFNKDYILTSIGGDKNSCSGIVAIKKRTGQVYTMLYSYKKTNNNQIITNINSDTFCIMGEVNSKSKGLTKTGKSCFKFNQNGFELEEDKKPTPLVSKKIFPIVFNKNEILCNSKKCKSEPLINQNLNNISRNESGPSLQLMVNERGFDSEYIDASDDKNILYLVVYGEGDNDVKSLFLVYFFQSRFKTKSLGNIKSLNITDTNHIIFNGKKIKYD